MNEFQDRRLLTVDTRGGWLQRVLFAIMAVSLAVVGFFFITIAIIAAAFIALAIGVRWWWVLRRLRAHAKRSEAIEGEYTVVEHAGAIEREPKR
jgi:hypothetical protein